MYTEIKIRCLEGIGKKVQQQPLKPGSSMTNAIPS